MVKCRSISFLTCIALSCAAGIEISTKLDFDNERTLKSESSRDKSEPVVIVVGNSNTGTRKDNPGFRSSRPRPGGNTGVRCTDKSIRSRCNYPNHPRPARPKTVEKNIYIFVDGKEGRPENFECKDDVCQTILSTEKDQAGNVVEKVRLTVVMKKYEPQGGRKDEEVPVIDGLRGIEYEDRNPTIFYDSGTSPNGAPPFPTFLDNNIPQAPVPRQDFAPRRYPLRPHSATFYPRNSDPRKELPAWGSPWTPVHPNRPSVDDKIEPPLSQTNAGDQ